MTLPPLRRVLPVLVLSTMVASLAFAKGVPKKREPDDVRGMRIWVEQCQACHGESNDGQGPAAAALPGGVPDLRGKMDPETQQAQVDIILNGKGDMPAFRESFQNPVKDADLVLRYLGMLDRGERKPGTPLPDQSKTTGP
ncbi:MAG: cytochrome c [Myxococcota bacterium]|nr:cytochrome c [Myxococcota bacterium]